MLSFWLKKLVLPVCLFLAASGVAWAQSSVWGASSANVSKHAQSGRDKLKRWKQHLQQWGLDANYHHEADFGLKLNTNGWSGCMDLQHRISKRKMAIYTISFSEIKDDKQIKQQGTNSAFPYLGNPSPYVFGKVNNLYTLQLGYGRQVLLLPAVLEDNISLSFRYSGGFSLAMLKPYYLKLINIDYNQPNDPATLQQEKYSSANAGRFLNTGYILGAGDWTKGLGDMQYVPGAFIEGAVVIQPGRERSFVQTVTIGGNAALYAQSLPIMADRAPNAWQASFFIGLTLGKRWR